MKLSCVSAFCDTLKADNRTFSGVMNQVSLNSLNLFPTLAVPLSGEVNKITYFGWRFGDVFVSFMRRIE